MDLDVHYDKIVSSFSDWKSQERSRASEAGEMREEIGQFLELTGLNKKAVSFVRALDKLEADKRDDVLRSLTPLLEVMDRAWNGNRTPDMFEQPAVETASDAPRKPSYEQDFTVEDDPVDPEIAAEDEAFESHLAEVAAQ